MVVCDVVVARSSPALGFGAELFDVLEDAGIRFLPTESRAAVRAGEMQRRYKQRLKAEGRVLASPRTIPDFLIGAHALLQCSGSSPATPVSSATTSRACKVIVPKAA